MPTLSTNKITPANSLLYCIVFAIRSLAPDVDEVLVSLSVYINIVDLCVCPSVCPSIRLSVSPSVCYIPSCNVCLAAGNKCLWGYLRLSVCLSVCLLCSQL